MFRLIQLVNKQANAGIGNNESTSNGNPNHSVNKVSSTHLKELADETMGNGTEDTLRVDSLAETQVFDEQYSAAHVANNCMNGHDPKSANVVVTRSSGLQKRPEPVAGPSGLQQSGTCSESQEMQVDHENSSISSIISSKRGSALYNDREYEDSSNDELRNNHLANKSTEPQKKRKKRLAQNLNTGKYLC